MRKYSRKEQERLNRRAWILDSSEELMRQHGVVRVGMEQIAQHAECAKGTLYQHFTSKEHIILALAERSLTQLLSDTERATEGIRSPLHRLFAVFETLVQHSHNAPVSYTHHVLAMLEDDRPEHKMDPALRGSLDRLHHSLRATVVSLAREATMLGEVTPGTTPEAELQDGLLALVDLILTSPVRRKGESTPPVWTLLDQVFTGTPWAASGTLQHSDIEGTRAKARANLAPSRTVVSQPNAAM